MLSSTFSSHSLLSAGRQAIHDGPAFPGVVTISPGRQATSHCSAAQILSVPKLKQKYCLSWLNILCAATELADAALK